MLMLAFGLFAPLTICNGRMNRWIVCCSSSCVKQVSPPSHGKRWWATAPRPCCFLSSQLRWTAAGFRVSSRSGWRCRTRSATTACPEDTQTDRGQRSKVVPAWATTCDRSVGVQEGEVRLKAAGVNSTQVRVSSNAECELQFKHKHRKCLGVCWGRHLGITQFYIFVISFAFSYTVKIYEQYVILNWLHFWTVYQGEKESYG